MDPDFLSKKAYVKTTFDGWVEDSIFYIYQGLKEDKSNKTTPLMAYLLVSCAIDFIAGFYAGRDTKNSTGLGKQYKDFVRNFMAGYDEDILYKHLRCALAHNFALGDILLTHNNSSVHLKKYKGVLALNFENFFNDYKIAVEKYFSMLDIDIDLQNKFLKRYNSGGVLTVRSVII